MDRICIVAAMRTPQGRFLGTLTKYSAVELATEAGKAVLQQTDAEKIDQVIMGNVLAAGQGMNIARQLGVGLGIPLDRPAMTVNVMCGSGMQAIMLAGQAILAGEADVVLCGGTESMTNAPYLLERARGGYRLGDGVCVDSILRDGLTDPFSKEPMGLAVESLAEKYKISRDEQDRFAANSQQKCAKALAKGKFNDELVKVGKLEQDEHPRPDATLEKLSALGPVFSKNGTVTAGNASGINDGASMVVVCSEAAAKKNGFKPLAIIRGWTSVGCDPKVTGLGAVYAAQKLCDKLKMKYADFDAIEINEAFAAQVLACVREMKIDQEILNPDGGAIALGHPIGASGARLIVHLAHRICRGETKKGLATICAGGGMGLAVVLESV